MQIALIEFARHVMGKSDANSTEFNKNTPDPVVGLISEWQDALGNTEVRSEHSDMGGTMRLGGQVCVLKEGSLVREVYGQRQVIERHRHRYEVNNHYVSEFEQAGLVVSGRSIDGNLVEMIELPSNDWFVGCQFHPEFTSNPRDGHPLFTHFIEACLKTEKAAKV